LPERFAKPEEPSDLYARLAIEITTELVNDIATIVKNVCQDRDVRRPGEQGVELASQSFLKVSPADERSTAAEVLCAAWKIRTNFGDWHISGTEDIRKIGILNDLVLKSFEVNEWQALQ
jgi:methylaspartate ammonia-lyase